MLFISGIAKGLARAAPGAALASGALSGHNTAVKTSGHLREANSLRLGLFHGFLCIGRGWRGQPG